MGFKFTFLLTKENKKYPKENIYLEITCANVKAYINFIGIVIRHVKAMWPHAYTNLNVYITNTLYKE